MGIHFKDYYQALGVERDASAEEIKRAFRKQAREYHPDHNKAPEAEARFKELNEAYEVLRDPEKRAKYDRFGENWKHGQEFTPPPEWEQAGFGAQGGPRSHEFHFGGTGFSDFFEAFFGSGGGFGGHSSGFEDMFGGAADHSHRFRGRPGGRGPRQARNMEADLLVTLEEAEAGAERTVTLQRQDPRTGAQTEQRLKVRIPAGVREGQRIRLAGQGGQADAGGRPGDLLLRVRLEQHPDFEVRGADIVYELELPAWEAALGVKKRVPTLRQLVAVNVPAGATGGQKLRLKGLGRLKEDGHRGDLLVVLRVRAPEPCTPEQKEAWQNLARTYQKQ